MLGKPFENVTVKSFGDILNHSRGKINEDEIRTSNSHFDFFHHEGHEGHEEKRGKWG